MANWEQKEGNGRVRCLLCARWVAETLNGYCRGCYMWLSERRFNRRATRQQKEGE